MRKPFFRKQTQSWYVKDDDGRFIFLAKTKGKADAKWKSMLAGAASGPDTVTLRALCEDFLEEHVSLLATDRFKDASRVLRLLVKDLGLNCKARQLTAGKLTAWLQAPKPGRLRKPLADGTEQRSPDIQWSATRQRDASAWVNRVIKWGVATDRLRKSPLVGFTSPTPSSRDGVIAPEVHKQLVSAAMASTQSRSFAIYLIASHCGARPQQIREVTAAHCTEDFRSATFRTHKTARSTGKPLTVYFPPCLQTLLKILAARRPTGPLFLNDRGRPWTKDTAAKRMKRLRQELGLPEGTVLYLYRHTFATDSLRAGQSEAVTAALLGHTNSEMVKRIYGHLKKHDELLIEAAANAAAKRLTG